MSETSHGWFSRLKQGLHRTRVNIVGLFSGGVVDEDFLEELEFALISADVGMDATTRILQRLRDQIKLKGLKTQDEVRLVLRDELYQMLLPAQKPLVIGDQKPFVMMMVGVNGAGKTTSIGKLAKWLVGQGKTILLAAGDTFRAAAREQLAVWGERNQIEMISQQGGDPAAVVFDTINAGKKRHTDVVIADTAGRLPTQVNLMEELRRIRRSQAKALEGAPHEVLLVIDGTNGQNALMQVKAFDAAADLTGLIITKLDGTAKGGVLVAITQMRKDNPLPIYFIGVGESIEDLQPFNALHFANTLVGLDPSTPLESADSQDGTEAQ
ncbi:MAG: signal recognition particle-docking protein FtsY [Sutterella sp.]|nr:signal recognition particle-docking protein FtsY [Sutterella sp.]